jgi:hypothetical protein
MLLLMHAHFTVFVLIRFLALLLLLLLLFLLLSISTSPRSKTLPAKYPAQLYGAKPSAVRSCWMLKWEHAIQANRFHHVAHAILIASFAAAMLFCALLHLLQLLQLLALCLAAWWLLLWPLLLHPEAQAGTPPVQRMQQHKQKSVSLGQRCRSAVG